MGFVKRNAREALRTVVTETCQCCGGRHRFQISWEATLLREAQCENCGASLRNSDLLHVLAGTVIHGKPFQKCRNDLQILNASSYGGVHRTLQSLPGYFFSEFFPDIPSGERAANGVLCVDLCHIPFADESLDVVITEDVFEHIEDYMSAFYEIKRVLRPGGVHVFTVPIREDGRSICRKELPPVYHDAPTGTSGALVYNDFSFDLCETFTDQQVKTIYRECHHFYSRDQVTKLEEEYEAYRLQKDRPLSFYRLNSGVFVMRKKLRTGEQTVEFTGERFVPGQTDLELEIEHMNRYQFARQFVKDKRVLDAACGVGFGTELLSRDADFVTGIDISEESIIFAQQQYGGARLAFQTASIEKLPFPDRSFDVVVSFETLEHVNESVQQKFLAEIDRVLTDDGILVMSTPNHSVYSRRGINAFHVKELEYDEFEHLLRSRFSHVRLFSQQFEICNAIVDGQNALGWTEGGLTGQQAEYLIAVCLKKQASYEITSRITVRSDEKLNRLTTWAIENHEQNRKNNIHLAKLNDQIASEQQSLAELRGQIKAFKTQLQNQSGHIELLLQSERELKAETERQNTVIAEKNAQMEKQAIQIAKLEEDLRNKTGWVAQLIQSERELKQTVLNKEGHIQLLLESDRELDRIKSSRSWRFMGYFWRLRDFLIPQGSRRRLAGKLVVKFVKHPLRFLSKCTPKRIRNFFRAVQREGPDSASRRLQDCLQSASLPETKIALEPVDIQAAKGVADYAKLTAPQWEEPIVSIIIPVYNQFDYTYACIKSILANSGEVSYEIIVADDCSTDLTEKIEEIISGLRVIRNQENLRFLLNCNYAAKQARGPYILFLNNDTQVQENWLQPLIDLMDRDDTIGLTGSKLVYPDGRLQEAGGILWRDASAWNYGNRSDPSLPEYNYVKEADYISGAAMMIRRALWEEIGGFDERFAPAYCEDSDLAFEVRKHGYKVMYQPLSVVVHFEGVSNGTDTTSGQKAYQTINQRNFFEKWRSVLENDHFPNGEHVFLARDRSRKKKTLLMIDHYVPMYDKDAGSRTIFQYIKLFANMGYHIKFLGDNFYPHQPYTQQLQQMGVEVLVGPYYSKHWKAWLLENGQSIHYAFMNRPHITIKYMDEVRRCTSAKIVYNLCDLHFLREQREYEITGNQACFKSAEKWKKIELSLAEKADAVLSLSTVEKDILAGYGYGNKTEICPIFVYDAFPWRADRREATHDLLFVGGFKHHPNIDAVKWFCNEVFPLIVNKIPEICFHIVGSNPPEEIQALATAQILVEGFVSDEALDALYQCCRVCVIPLRYGAGVKGKTVEAMYHGIPIVSTSIGIEGLPQIETCVTPVDQAEAFAEMVVETYTKNNDKNAKQCLDYVKKNFSVQTTSAFFSKVFPQEGI